ncbi:MAG: tRNA (adenosine(37)-N6)-threonylcarbamoyltransferase complex ATPase subunit type 1 TsaE [Candidatus Cloacimonetes bacterium]|nr:tRNA (adenosine(37)-N6)-threonylcarbamoyltransferase complex ATPase subunit type 1 TsaE [Candidatus Cloacimonadota bacterium]MDY0367643.1 tRNA (adenosine(37)-N6)-threonylcarbamoyltransferase complex ATPase subunit type 1 TsaE [Candidatus Syntrophosphaera sp.]
MTKPKIMQLNTEQDTRDLAVFIAPLLRPGDVICLWGDLGSGKTFFTRALAAALGITELVDSPSFVLLKEYTGGKFPLFHLDLYRLKNAADFLDLGITDLIDSGVTLIEWPELAAQYLPQRILNLSLRFSYQGRQRSVEIVAKDRFSVYFV